MVPDVKKKNGIRRRFTNRSKERRRSGLLNIYSRANIINGIATTELANAKKDGCSGSRPDAPWRRACNCQGFVNNVHKERTIKRVSRSKIYSGA